MFCPECGNFIAPGEDICKGCGKLSSTIRNELLAMSEQMSASKCGKCGADVFPGQNYCATCGLKLKS